MAEPMVLNVELTKEDFVASIRAFSMRQVPTLITLSVVALVALAGLILGFSEGFSENSFGLVFVMALAFYLYFILFANPRMYGQAASRNPRLLAAATWKFDPQEGLTIHREAGDKEFPWESIRRVVETKAYYLFTYKGRASVFQILPKRVFQSGEQEQALRDLLKDHKKL